MMQAKQRHSFRNIRVVIGAIWVVFVCCYYVYAYMNYLYTYYPVLQQIRELGIIGLLKRFFNP